MEIDFNTSQQLQAIESLHNSKVKTPRSMEIMEKRIRFVKTTINRYRRMAGLKPGKVSENYITLANMIEEKLKAATAEKNQ